MSPVVVFLMGFICAPIVAFGAGGIWVWCASRKPCGRMSRLFQRVATENTKSALYLRQRCADTTQPEAGK